MPVYTGLRSRPSIHMQRQGSASYVSSQAFVESIPKAAVFSAIAVVAALMIVGMFWIHELHETSFIAEIDASVSTGSIKSN
jgi:hypothetical protein